MSKQLKYGIPYKLYSTKIHNGHYENCPAPQYLEKFDTVYTKNGLVTVSQFNWAHNKGKSIWTVFETVINGLVYRAELEEAPISNQSLKGLSTKFINYCISKAVEQINNR